MKERVKELLEQLAMGRRAAAEELAELLCPDKVIELPVVDPAPPAAKATAKKAR